MAARLGFATVALLALTTAALNAGQQKKALPLSNSRLAWVEQNMVRGVGLNCHGSLLPTSKMRDIGIDWVRIDLPERDFNRARVREVVNHYRGFEILWLITQDFRNPVSAAQILTDEGIRNIEVFNEPTYSHISATDYAATLNRVRGAVKDKAVVYGPALSTWTDEKHFLNDAIDAGMQIDVLSFHGYVGKPDQVKAALADAKRYGIPAIISEVSYPNFLGPNSYRAKMGGSPGSYFLQLKDQLAGSTWCWYDGPKTDDQGCGLFDWDGRNFSVPTPTYNEIVRGLRGR